MSTWPGYWLRLTLMYWYFGRSSSSHVCRNGHNEQIFTFINGRCNASDPLCRNPLSASVAERGPWRESARIPCYPVCGYTCSWRWHLRISQIYSIRLQLPHTAYTQNRHGGQPEAEDPSANSCSAWPQQIWGNIEAMLLATCACRDQEVYASRT